MGGKDIFPDAWARIEGDVGLDCTEEAAFARLGKPASEPPARNPKRNLRDRFDQFLASLPAEADYKAESRKFFRRNKLLGERINLPAGKSLHTVQLASSFPDIVVDADDFAGYERGEVSAVEEALRRDYCQSLANEEELQRRRELTQKLRDLKSRLGGTKLPYLWSFKLEENGASPEAALFRLPCRLGLEDLKARARYLLIRFFPHASMHVARPTAFDAGSRLLKDPITWEPGGYTRPHPDCRTAPSGLEEFYQIPPRFDEITAVDPFNACRKIGNPTA